MSAPAAFQATYFTHKPIVTRGVVQVVFEIPSERLLEVLQALQPRPGQDQVEVAIARLQPPQAAQKPASEAPKRKWEELPLGQQAAIRCGEPGFHKFLSEVHPQYLYNCGNSPAATIRALCVVESRSKITRGSLAGEAWEKIDADYYRWQRGAR